MANFPAWLKRLVRAKQRPIRNRARRHLALEQLESRDAPATHTWTGGGGANTNWSNPLNWSGGTPTGGLDLDGALGDLVFPASVIPTAPLFNDIAPPSGGVPNAASTLWKSWTTHRRRQPTQVLHVADFMHMLPTPATLRAQTDLRRLQGRGGLWFAGGYLFPYDAQETALLSATEVADRLTGGRRPARLALSPTL